MPDNEIKVCVMRSPPSSSFVWSYIVIDFKLNDLKHSGESGMNLTYELLRKLQVLDSPHNIATSLGIS